MTDSTPQTTPTRDEAVPAGWKLVPIEPTDEMIRPLFEAIRAFTERESDDLDLEQAWRAMLASAPAPASGRVDAARGRLNEKALEAACEAVLAVPDHPGDKQKIRDAVSTYLAALANPSRAES